MAATHIGVFFDIASGKARRVVVPETDLELDTMHYLEDGEALMKVLAAGYPVILGLSHVAEIVAQVEAHLAAQKPK